MGYEFSNNATGRLLGLAANPNQWICISGSVSAFSFGALFERPASSPRSSARITLRPTIRATLDPEPFPARSPKLLYSCVSRSRDLIFSFAHVPIRFVEQASAQPGDPSGREGKMAGSMPTTSTLTTSTPTIATPAATVIDRTKQTVRGRIPGKTRARLGRLLISSCLALLFAACGFGNRVAPSQERVEGTLQIVGQATPDAAAETSVPEPPPETDETETDATETGATETDANLTDEGETANTGEQADAAEPPAVENADTEPDGSDADTGTGSTQDSAQDSTGENIGGSATGDEQRTPTVDLAALLPTPTPNPASSPAATEMAFLIPTNTPDAAPDAASGTTSGTAPDATPDTPSSAQPQAVALNGINVRGGPGTDYPVVGGMALGDRADIVGKNPESDWWQIVLPDGVEGWVYAPLVEAQGNVEGIAVAADIPTPPPPTETPTPAPPAEAPPAEAAPPEPTPAETPAETPAADAPAADGPVFRVVEKRLWDVVENGGQLDGPSVTCGLKRELVVNVLDANGNRLNGVAVQAQYGAKEIFVTGSQGKGDGVAEFILGRGQDVRVIRDANGQEVTSETATGLSTEPAAIPYEYLISGGYCADEASCGLFVGAASCWGHYSWTVTFQRNY